MFRLRAPGGVPGYATAEMTSLGLLVQWISCGLKAARAQIPANQGEADEFISHDVRDAAGPGMGNILGKTNDR